MAEESESAHAKNGDNYLDPIIEPPEEFRQGFEHITYNIDRHIIRSISPTIAPEPLEPTIVVCEAIVEHMSTPSRLNAASLASTFADVGMSTFGKTTNAYGPMPCSRPQRTPPVMMFHEEHLATWHDDPKHNERYENEQRYKSPKQTCPRNRINNSNLCPSMSGNPHFAALHTEETRSKSEDWDYIMSEPELPTIAESNIYEEPIKVQPKRNKNKRKYDLEEEVTANTRLEVTSFPNTSQRLNKKWLIQMFSYFTGYRGLVLNWKETKANVFYSTNEQVRWARYNLHGIRMFGSEYLQIKIIDMADPLQESNDCWTSKLNICCFPWSGPKWNDDNEL